MISKTIKKIMIFLIFVITFFCDKQNVLAISSDVEGKCIWYTYQSFYEPTSDNVVNAQELENGVISSLNLQNITSNTYRLALIINNGEATVNLSSFSPPGKFKISMIDPNFVNTMITNYYDSDKKRLNCPEYVSFKLEKPSIGPQVSYLEITERSNFMNYIGSQYKDIMFKINEDEEVYYANLIESSSSKPIVFTSKQITVEQKRYNILSQLLEGEETVNDVYGLTDDNDIEYKSEFYSKTKNIWDAKINLIKNDENYEYCSTSAFSSGISGVAEKIKTCSEIIMEKDAFYQWFSAMGPIILEKEGYVVFGEYFKFSRTGIIVPETIQEKLDILSKAQEYEKYINDKEQVENDRCLALCSTDGVTIDTQGCVNYSDEYSTCTAAVKQCGNIASSQSQTECFNAQMGEELYTKYKNSYSNYISSIDNKIEEIEAAIQDTLSNINSPLFEGIVFSNKGYEVKCEDVEFLHDIYTIMKIIAPVLVIVFGTFDYTKSVMGADEKQILEARKKFPKRLILLLLFIFVPIIIEIILSFFGGETSLMKCIVSGS